MGRWSFCHKKKSGLADTYLALTGIRLVLGHLQWTQSVPTEVMRLGVGSGPSLPVPHTQAAAQREPHQHTSTAVLVPCGRSQSAPLTCLSGSAPYLAPCWSAGGRWAWGRSPDDGGSGLGHPSYPGSSESQGPERGCRGANAVPAMMAWTPAPSGGGVEGAEAWVSPSPSGTLLR